jgi:starch synthase
MQAALNLPLKEKIPVFGFVARLCHQKGVDLIVETIEDIVRTGSHIMITGVGEKKYHRMLEACAEKFPRNIGLHMKFDEKVAHKIYAASDFFLMPSVFEPCGLGQMIALRYGAIPVVHKTGGLADTIRLYDPIHHTGNGFLFSEFTRVAFVQAINEALKVYRHRAQMEFLLRHAFRYRFSWDKSAKEYQRVYQQCIS